MFNQFIFEHDGRDLAQSDVEKDLVRMLNLKYKIHAPLRPSRVVIAGPPGSGRSAQAETLSQTFGLVNVCV